MALGTTAHATSGAFTDNPEAYLPGDRRRALAEGRTLPDRVLGAALFADISGFTPLTEALARELGPQRGAEELTAHLNRVFHAVIGDVHRFGGDVISFGGDAITCWLEGDDGTRAAACGLAIQATMASVGHIVTPGGNEVLLAIKVAVAVGSARRFVVGDPSIQLVDVLAGRLVDELAEAERHAHKGDVVLSGSALRSLGDRVVLTEMRLGDEPDAAVGVVDRLVVAVAERPSAPLRAPLPEELVRPWLLPAVYERLASGRGQFLAELRPAYPVFARFGGLDYDHDPDCVAKLDDFVRRSQGILSSYGGSLLQLILGDKGAYLYAVFGAPQAHEDDAARACAAALELLNLERGSSVVDLQIGITHGRLRSGAYGHAERRTFTCLGDAVNVAARLMASAPVGHVYVSEDVQAAAGDRVLCEPVGSLAVKGKAEPVNVFSLVSLRRGPRQRELRYPLPIVGRDAELASLTRARDDVLVGASRVVGVAADAGRGKSRLIAEVVRGYRSLGLTVVFGEAQAFGQTSSYLVWREAWRALFGLDDELSEPEQRQTLVRQLTAIDRAHARRAPLLAAVVGVDLPDNDLTRGFDAKLRKASLEALLVDVLRSRAKAEPLVIVLEDCHWIDPLSRDLLEVIVRATATLPVLFLLAYRPADSPGGGLGLEGLPQFSELALGELGPDEAEQVVMAKLRQLFGPDRSVAPELVQLVTERAQGNPFYLEELINYVYGLGIDPGDAQAIAHLDAPDSLQRLVLSRIDMLPEAPRSTLKVASVIGRTFDTPVLQGVYPEHGALGEVEASLEVARRADLVNVDVIEDRSWLFRHVVTREVAYESLPFAMRASLHVRVGLYLETRESAESDLDLLAHHYWLGDDSAKKLEFLVRAGIAAQARYANDAAVDYYRRAIPLLSGAERADVVRRLAKVLELRGGWADAEATYGEALELYGGLDDELGQARVRTDLAEAMRKQGRFDDSRRQLDVARAVFRRLDDDAGLGLVLHLGGTLSSQQGRYDDARASYEASLTIREGLGDRLSVGGLLSNLAVVAECEGDYALARSFNERALAVREEVGDKWAICVSQNNLGMVALLQKDFDGARGRFEESMRLAAEVGDRWVIAVGHHNLGNATLGLGAFDEAGTHYVEALRAYEEYDDQWSVTLLVEDVALFAVARGRAHEALELVGAADALRDRLDAPRPPAPAAVIEEALAALRAESGAEADSVQNDGRLLSGAALSEAVRSVCAQGDTP